MTSLLTCTTGRGRLERRYRRGHPASCRYYLRIAGPVRVRVPWLVWALFS